MFVDLAFFPRFSHGMCIALASLDAGGFMAGWRARLARAGVEILDGIPIPGHARFEFRDPFGNRVELIEPIEDTRLTR